MASADYFYDPEISKPMLEVTRPDAALLKGVGGCAALKAGLIGEYENKTYPDSEMKDGWETEKHKFAVVQGELKMRRERAPAILKRINELISSLSPDERSEARLLNEGCPPGYVPGSGRPRLTEDQCQSTIRYFTTRIQGRIKGLSGPYRRESVCPSDYVLVHDERSGDPYCEPAPATKTQKLERWLGSDWAKDKRVEPRYESFYTSSGDSFASINYGAPNVRIVLEEGRWVHLYQYAKTLPEFHVEIDLEHLATGRPYTMEETGLMTPKSYSIHGIAASMAGDQVDAVPIEHVESLEQFLARALPRECAADSRESASAIDEGADAKHGVADAGGAALPAARPARNGSGREKAN